MIPITQFEQQLAVVVNRWINQTGTVDAVLAQYVTDCLITLNHARNALAQIPAHAVPQS